MQLNSYENTEPQGTLGCMLQKTADFSLDLFNLFLILNNNFTRDCSMPILVIGIIQLS